MENEFDSARLYLARWARVVAEEGERARRTEVVRQAGLDEEVRVGSEDLASSLGVFSLLTSPNSKRPIPHPTRTPHHPITARDWESFAAQGRDELFVRREIFRRGFSDSTEPEETRARREGWEVLLGVVPWSVGGLRCDQAGRSTRAQGREALRQEKREEYAAMKKNWKHQLNCGFHQEDWKEEWHRIDVCRSQLGSLLGDADANRLIVGVPTGLSLSMLFHRRQYKRGKKRRKREELEQDGTVWARKRRVEWRDSTVCLPFANLPHVLICQHISRHFGPSS